MAKSDRLGGVHAGLALHERIGDVLGQELFLFEKARNWSPAS